MTTKGRTFWPLNGRLDWHTAQAAQASASATGLRLTGNPTGPLDFEWIDDSLGGVIMPRGLALDAHGTLFVLSRERSTIKRFDHELQRFVEIPAVGGIGRDARQFHLPMNIAIAGDNLYVIDRGNRRVQVFGLNPAWPLRYVWGPWNADQERVKYTAPAAWQPSDVAAHSSTVYILDRKYGRVYRHEAGHDRLTRVIDEPTAQRRWTRLAVDRAGRIYLLDRRQHRLEIYDARGQRLDQATDANDIRDRFDAPRVRLHYRSRFDRRSRGRFCLPQTDACGLVSQPTSTAAFGPLAAACGLVFNREGQPDLIEPDEPLGPPWYATHGVWMSDALDSRIHRCLWHRIEIDLADLPAGTQVTISSCSADSNNEPPAEQSPHWSECATITGEMQPPDRSTQPARQTIDCLVQSREGQYLWLKIELRGDGFATPVVAALRVHYPRESYVQYLPAVYSADDNSRWFLERFLSIFQTEWEALEDQVERAARLFDPLAVPAGPFLHLLARWLALPLEDTWKDEQQRHLLQAAADLYRLRGTLAGLKRYLQVYVQNMSGLSPADQRDFPQIIEGFRLRQRAMLSVPEHDHLAQQTVLWGAAAVGRLQLDVFSREGKVRLISTGDPARDLFHEYAHRVRVFIPACWVRTADDEAMLRRALEAEKPAHVGYDLCLVESRLCVGLQSTIGLDTILGSYPAAYLTCPAAREGQSRLGVDTVLAGTSSAAHPPRVGIETILW